MCLARTAYGWSTPVDDPTAATLAGTVGGTGATATNGTGTGAAAGAARTASSAAPPCSWSGRASRLSGQVRLGWASAESRLTGRWPAVRADGRQMQPAVLFHQLQVAGLVVARACPQLRR